MKKKNIVQDVNKKTPIYKDKRWTLVAILILLMLAFSVMTMPMADIPFLGRMGHIFGLNDDSMRSLNFTDFAAYSLGAKDGGRLASVRSSQYSAYENAGGLSPFSLQAGNRMIDAKESYLAEFDRTGKWNNIRGSASGRDIQDPEGVTIPSYYSRESIKAVAPTIDPDSAKGYEDAYGKPLVKSFESSSLDAAYEASSVTEYDSNGVMVLRSSDKNKPFRSSDTGEKIRSARSDEDNVYFQAVDSKVKALRAGRLGSMGGNGAKTMRVGTSIGAGRQLNAFGFSGKDMGRVYYLSSQATGQKYSDVAKNVAEAAWDGGEIEAQDMVAVGEKSEKEVGSLEPPSNIIKKANKANTACIGAVKTGSAKVDQLTKELHEEMDKLDGMTVPCACRGNFIFGCKDERNDWNNQIQVIKGKCEAIRNEMIDFSSTCGFNYNESVNECTEYEKMKAHPTGSGFVNFWECIFTVTISCCGRRTELADNKYIDKDNRTKVAEDASEMDRWDKNDPVNGETFFGME